MRRPLTLALAALALAAAGCGETTRTTNVYQTTGGGGGGGTAPTLMFVEPNMGPTLGGNSVTLTGINFSAGCTVQFGTALATNVSIVSSSTIFCTAPAGPVGFVDVTVTNTAGALTVRPKAYEYRVPPVITTVMPPSGSANGGQTIVLYGTGFQAGCTVTFAGAAATGLVVSGGGTRLTCTNPAGSVGAATILVTNPDTLTDTDTFTYVTAGSDPVIGAFAPAASLAAGGGTVTISGLNFQTTGTTQVFFGITAATNVSVVNATTITVTVPAGTSGTVVDVTVVNPNGLSTTAFSAFGYDSAGTAPTFAGAQTATATSSFSIVVTWNAAVDNVTPATRILYSVYAATSTGGQVFTTPTLVTAPGATQAIVGGLAFGTAYYFVVRATDEVGNQDTNTVEVTATTPLAPVFTWRALSSLGTAREDHGAANLADGRILVAGGRSDTSSTSIYASTELYDVPNSTWTVSGALGTARWGHTTTVLPSGFVLAAGGDNAGTLSSAELFDPVNGTWTATGSLGTARVSHTATLLRNGQVLVVGGNGGSGALSSCELYGSGTWTSAAGLGTGRTVHASALLADGRVLSVGGEDGSGSLYASAEIFDPSTGTWTTTGSLNTAVRYHTATLIPGGQVLVAGGDASGSTTNAELFTPSAGTWTVVASLGTARALHTATLMPNGHVLVVGGDNVGPLNSAELYEPITNTWFGAGTTAASRFRHTATLLPVGEVVVVGGDGGGSAIANVEQDPNAGRPRTGPNMTVTHGYGHAAVPLPDGRVVVIAGYTAASPYVQVDLYNPVTGAWTQTAPIPGTSSWYYHTANLMHDGRVIVVGNAFSTAGGTPTNIWDPATGAWTTAGPMLTTYKAYHTSHTLANGKVLAVSGSDSTGSPSTGCQLYDPAAGTWTAAAPIPVQRYYHYGVTLRDGRVLVGGGYYLGYLFSTSLYSPTTNTWSNGPNMNHSRQYACAALLPNGRVLVVGGFGSNGISTTYLNTAEIYDPTGNTWSLTGNPTVGGYGGVVAALPSGRVFKAFGYNLAYRNNVELFDVQTGTWQAQAVMPYAGYQGRAVPLINGETMSVGGYSTTSGYTNGSYPFNEGRGYSDTWAPQIQLVNGSGASTVTLPYGTNVPLTGTRFRALGEGSGGDARAAAADVAVVTLEGPLGQDDKSYLSNVTNGIQVLPATFAADGQSLVVATPASGAIQKGCYWLRVTVAGMPSVARGVRFP